MPASSPDASTGASSRASSGGSPPPLVSGPQFAYPVGIGAGVLSVQAEDRLTRPVTPSPPPPPVDDQAAVDAWRRSIHEAWLAGDPPAEACGHRVVTIAGVRCLQAGPAAAALVMYLHGGGYALGSPEVALPITERLAQRVEIVSVEYRLAPEHPFPAAIDDALAVYRALSNQAPGRTLVVAGDSAGGNLALSVALRAGQAGLRRPDRLILLCPHLDLGPRPPQPDAGMDRPSMDEGVEQNESAWLRAAYCGIREPDDPLLSPLRADLRGLPPTLVQTGTADHLSAHSVRLARIARTAGVAVCLDVWDRMWHTWHYHRDLPEADRALDEAARFAAG